MTTQNIINAAESMGAQISISDDQLSIQLKARGYKAAATKLADALGVTVEPDTKRNNKPYWIIGGMQVVILHFPGLSSEYCINIHTDALDDAAEIAEAVEADDVAAELTPEEAAEQDAMIAAATAGLAEIAAEVLAEVEPSEADRLRAELAVVKTENERLKKTVAAARDMNDALIEQGAQMADELKAARHEIRELAETQYETRVASMQRGATLDEAADFLADSLAAAGGWGGGCRRYGLAIARPTNDERADGKESELITNGMSPSVAATALLESAGQVISKARVNSDEYDILVSCVAQNLGSDRLRQLNSSLAHMLAASPIQATETWHVLKEAPC